MVLDPVTAELLAAMADRPGVADGTVAEARALAREGMVALGASLPPIDVQFVHDRPIPGPDGELPVRIYRPEGSGPHGVLVWFHGGGFVLGDLDTHDRVCRRLCLGARATVVSVDYRLAPEHPFPAAVDDAATAVRWVQDHVDVVAGDPRRLAVGGDSAGATLAAVVAASWPDERRRPPLVAQVLVYPGTDHVGDHPSLADNAEGYGYTPRDRAWFYDHYLPAGVDRADPRVSPLRGALTGDEAPAIVVTGDHDILRDEGEAYAAALTAAGVDVDAWRVPGGIHGWLSWAELVPGFAEAADRLSVAVRRRLA